MANPRQAEKDMNEVTQEAGRRAAEQTSRAARIASDTGAEAARAAADIFQRNSETVRQMWDSGTKLAGQLAEQSMRRFASAFGASGEGAQNSIEVSARNLESISRSGTVLAKGMQTISREMVEFARKRIEQNLHRIDALARCRTPHEVIEAQTDLVRDNLEDFVLSTRRIAEVSMQMADEASRTLGEATLAPR